MEGQHGGLPKSIAKDSSRSASVIKAKSLLEDNISSKKEYTKIKALLRRQPSSTCSHLHLLILPIREFMSTLLYLLHGSVTQKRLTI